MVPDTVREPTDSALRISNSEAIMATRGHSFFVPPRGGEKRGRGLIHTVAAVGRSRRSRIPKTKKEEEEEEWEGRAETERTLQAPIWLAASHLVLERTEIKATYLTLP